MDALSEVQVSAGIFSRLCIGLVLLSGLLVACGEEPLAGTGVDTSGGADQAAIAAAVAWSATTSADVRDLDATIVQTSADAADVRVVGDVRYPPSGIWESFIILVPVLRQQPNIWIAPTTSVIDRLMRSSRSATAVAGDRVAQSPTATATDEPSTPTPPAPAPPPTLPPPPDGVVVYVSDWSDGLDGWIGTPDWSTEDGNLINDGSRASADPWLEAPVRVEPWQSMIVEFEIDLLGPEFGSFGLIARGGVAGWLNLGVRREAGEDEGSTSATLGATVRPNTERVLENWVVTPIQLDPGPHQFRIEVLADSIVMQIDGTEVARTTEGTYLTGDFLGLWSDRTPLVVRYFRVTLV